MRSGILPEQQKIYSVIPDLRLVKSIFLRGAIKSGLLGAFIGALPETGGDCSTYPAGR